jgi:hypothetical protein
MEQKFSNVYRTSFLTLDRYLQQSNAAQFYFRPLLPPLNTVSGEFYSLSPAQGTDPSIRINKYSSNGTFLGFGYLYDTSFNVPPADGSGGTVDVSGGYWTLTGSNIYNNNPGFVGVGTVAPAYPLDVSGYGAETVINATTDSKKAIRITQILATADAPAEIYFDKAANPAGALGIDTSSGRGMFLYYNGEDRVSIAPSGYVGIGTAPELPTTMLDVSGSTRIRGPALSNLLFVGDASLNNPVAEQDTVKIGTAGVGGRLVLGDDGKGVLRMLNAFGDSYIETGTNMAVGSSGRLIFSSMFDLSGGPTMTVNTGTDEVVISNRFIDPPVAGYKLTVDGSANVLGNIDVSNGIVHIQNGGNKSLLIGNPISDAWYEDDVQIINAQGNQEASIILGCDGSGALRFVNANSQTYIQSGLDISNNSGCKMNFTKFGSEIQTMTIDTSYQYVYVGTNSGNTYDGNQFVVDGSASITANLTSGHHLPQASYTYDLGSSSAYWRDLYLSTGTIYMGPSSRIRSSNPLTLDLSGNAGLYVTSNATVGRVYDTAFNPAPALATQTNTTLVDSSSVTVLPATDVRTFNTPSIAKGNYLLTLNWVAGAGSDTSGANIYIDILTGTGTPEGYYTTIPAYTIPGPFGNGTFTYTLVVQFVGNPTAEIYIDTSDISTAGGTLNNTSFSISALYLSPSP